ncbi:MAG: phosphate signaling complex protein PhoU [Anaerolineae bacterium]|jgi:phosphate transport system protein|nr:phosphate signaling complex protein PhoU [Ardenticatenia bacterium]MBK8539979.1 phosphate signaling complex protein PhoU [Ardenticatenia bacterium]HQZ69789.1 phosphate signaling complex protein PhoU [Anaerolineae bacterium]HRA18978.1 phosphate signaling complex protein PhoU [Anaerolineae bacterium]
MSTRSAFESEMRSLEDRLRAMADQVGAAVDQATRSLVENDSALARRIIEGDEVINRLWANLQRDILEIIARQQPLASDLREILAISAIITDLERIGDHAKRIAVTALEIADDPPTEPFVDIPRMALLACSLLQGQVDAFLQRDSQSARSIAVRDNEIDALYRKCYSDLLADMRADPATIDRGSKLMWTAKSIERIGDHVTNIGEWVVFLETGQLVELNA